MTFISDGIAVVGGVTKGYTQRQIVIEWDVAPDTITERQIYTNGFYRFITSRYFTTKDILYLYNTRWTGLCYDPQPITERFIFVHYIKRVFSDRTIYWYPDTKERMVFVESLYTATPLLLKYPKYMNWNYIPQVITPEFRIWSYYPLDEDSIVLRITTDLGKLIILKSSVDKDKFNIQYEGNHVYKIRVTVDEVFEPGEKVTCYLSLYDIKENYLKEGMW